MKAVGYGVLGGLQQLPLCIDIMTPIVPKREQPPSVVQIIGQASFIMEVPVTIIISIIPTILLSSGKLNRVPSPL